MVEQFIINEKENIVARSEKTRNGFRHVVEYYKDGRMVETAKVCYLNRTWESYDFETAIRKLLEKMNMDDAEKRHIIDVCAKIANGETERMFGSVRAVAMMGDILCSGQKEKNDWKARMLKAGLGSSGLEIPEDWDTLTEDDKEKRLNNVIEAMKQRC